MKKLYSVEIKGDSSQWGIHVYAKKEWVEDWRNDGLEILEMENIIPESIVRFRLTKQWVFMQDLFNFKNPWGKK